MSTRAIRKALALLRDAEPAAGEGYSREADAALVEVEAVEKAAKALTSGLPGVINDEAIDAWLDVGESIAEESAQ